MTNVMNVGQPSMAENYQIARLMIALREAGLALSKDNNVAMNAGISPYLALVRSLSMATPAREAEKIVGLKRLAWCMAKQAGGSITLDRDVVENFNAERAVLTQHVTAFGKTVVIEAGEYPAADVALKEVENETAKEL